jgi:hypothetical protein
LASGSFVRAKCSQNGCWFFLQPSLTPPETALTRSQTLNKVTAEGVGEWRVSGPTLKAFLAAIVFLTMRRHFVHIQVISHLYLHASQIS